jgi:3'(2'), 5'-bisphosphate nucleotidase
MSVVTVPPPQQPGPMNPARRPESYAAELECARMAALAGGARIMEFYGSVTATLKEGGSPVTAADHAASDAIIAHLAERFPDDAILCEETADDPARLNARRVWVVDPLDGTKEFLAQNGEFSVMIGLVVDARPVVGVVYLPAVNVLYSAAEGMGAWVERADTRTRLRCAQPTGGLRIVTSRSHADAFVESMCALLPITQRRPSGSVGIKCALIAEGECDLYAHPVPYMGEWDTCAPEVILREAGGSVTDCTGTPLRYNKPEPRQPLGILACAPGILPTVLPVIAGAIASRG